MTPDLKVEVVRVDSLTPDPENARVHSAKNLEAIAGSLRRFGQRRPLVCYGSTVIAGNGTLEAARSIGWERITITRVPRDWSVEQARAYALADNRTAELAEWDQTVLADQLVNLDAVGWDVSEFGFEPLTPPTDPEVLDETDLTPPSVPVSSLGDLWLLGGHRVLCGDSSHASSYARLLDGATADIVWTDPPYGVDVQERDLQQAQVRGRRKDGKGVMNDNLTPEALLELLRSSLGAAHQASRPGAAWYVASPAGDLFHTFGTALLELQVWRHTLIWVKDVFVMGRADYHYKHEPIFYGWKSGAAHTWNGGRKQDTILEVPRPKRSEDHPTMKPIALIARCIDNSSNPGDLVLDPFGGSGSTLLAAHATGRRAALIELDPSYVDVICRRYQQSTGVAPVLESTGEPHNFWPVITSAEG